MTINRIIGFSLLGISTLFMIFFLLRKNESFFNLNGIIKKHLLIFKHCKFQYVIFYIVPLIFAAGLSMIYTAGETFYSELSVVVSILLTMLFAILSVLTSRKYNVVNKTLRAKICSTVNETINAIIFDVLLCVFLLLYSLVMVILDSVPNITGIIKQILAGISYYIFAVILLTLLLIVKRLSKIIEFNLTIDKEKDE